MKDPKFLLAIVMYAALGVSAWFTLDHELLWIVWLLLLVLAVKTVVVVLKNRLD